MNRRLISELDRARVIALVEEGHSQRFVADRVGVSQSDVSRIWNRFLETNSVQNRHRSGRPRVTNDQQNRFIRISIRRNPSMSIPTLQREFRHATGARISLATIRRRIFESGLRCRRPIRVPQLQHRHRLHRLQWSQEHIQLPQQFWNTVLFSDETRICVNSDSRRIRVWREPTRAAQLAHARPVRPFAGGNAMFWAGIMASDRTELVLIDGTLTGQRYITQVLEPHVRLWRGAVGEDFVFMDDNARPHRSQAVNQYLETQGIRRLEWPAMSPDMNPIEHVWDMLSRAIHSRRNPPRTRQELVVAAREEWEILPQEAIDNLVNSIRARMQACIDAHGGNTLY